MLQQIRAHPPQRGIILDGMLMSSSYAFYRLRIVVMLWQTMTNQGHVP